MPAIEQKMPAGRLGDAWNGIVRREQIGILIRQAPFLALANIINSTLVVFVIANQAPLPLRAGWWAVVLLIALYPLKNWLQSLRAPISRPVSPRGIYRSIIVAGISGLIWASAAPLFATQLNDRDELLLMIILSGMAAGGAVTLSSVPKASFVYVASIGVIVLAYMFSQGTVLHASLGAMLLLFFTITLFASNSVYLSAAEALRRRAEDVEHRAEMQERLHEFAAISSDWFWESDVNGVLLEIVNDEAGEVATRLDFQGKKLLVDIVPDAEEDLVAWREILQTRRAIRHQLCMITDTGGGMRRVSVNGLPRFDGHGNFMGYRGTFTDLTGVLAAQARAEHAENLLRDAVEAIPDALVLYDADDKVALFNDRHRRMFPSISQILAPGVSYETILRQQVLNGEFKDTAGREEEIIAVRLRAHNNRQTDDLQQFGDGRTVRLSERSTSMGGVVAVRTDITELTAARQDAQQAADRFLDFANSSADWFWEMDADLRFVWMSPNIEELLDVSPEWHYGKTRQDLLGPDYDLEQWAEHLAALRALRPFRDFVYPWTGDGIEARWLSTSGVPVFDDEGTFSGYRGCGRDVTQLRDAELRLQQTERLRAVGQLSGGIAHDFNNLLTAIIGNIELLEDSVVGDAEAERFLNVAKEAGQRGAILTQQLLAFGRRQDLSPTRTNIRTLVDQVVALIDRTIGENITIETQIPSDLRPVMVDAAQMQNALINLAINARDAMPDGGSLTIAARLTHLAPADLGGDRNIAPGHYLEFSVSDTGIGMPPEVLERAMEPFFTTKGVGEGSGLGLAMAHGFVAQSGGHVSLHSEFGAGTTVKLYLPAADAADQATEEDDIEAADVTVKGDETILLVEDDDAVRRFLNIALTRLGYTILEAEDGNVAAEIIRHGGRIDLLLSDVVLKGGVSGVEFATQFALSRPATQILLMSGHSGAALSGDMARDLEYHFVPKPVSRVQIAQKIRDILDHTDHQFHRADCA
ncbi:MAG: PAS-domain containing protein [Alphaproteobacteria bacterium]|nr:PAS-domain containing protein [Alphaproteobacteria bacterium]